MAEMALALAQYAGPSALGWWGSRQAANAQKRAGTTLANMAQEEEARANALPGRWNPFISQAYTDQMGNLLSTADTAATGIEGATTSGMAGARGVGREAAGYLDPYMQAGTRATTTLSDLVNAPEERFSGIDIDLTMDPSYQFRLAEGQKALERSAAARGTLRGGGTLKAITSYGQESASKEYQAAYARALDTFKANQQARQERMTNLSGLARLGGESAMGAGRFLQTGENFAGELGQRGMTEAGRLRTDAAGKAGNWGIESANKQMGINMGAEDIARQARGARAGTTAQSQMGVGDVWSNFWGGAGQNMGDWLATDPFGVKKERVGGGDYQTDADAASAAIRRYYGY